MASLFSGLSSLVPGVLMRGQELYEVYSSSSTGPKVEKYCRIAKALYSEGCCSSAQLTLSLAKSAVDATQANTLFGMDKIQWLCQIAEVRSLLAPTVLSAEIIQAVSLVEQVPHNDRTPILAWSEIFYEIAKGHIGTKASDQAKSFLQRAREYGRSNDLPLESVDILCKIASAQKLIDEGDAVVTLEAAFEIVRGMSKEFYLLVDCSSVVGRITHISLLYTSISCQKATEVVGFADQIIKNYTPDGNMEIEKAKELIKNARTVTSVWMRETLTNSKI